MLNPLSINGFGYGEQLKHSSRKNTFDKRIYLKSYLFDDSKFDITVWNWTVQTVKSVNKCYPTLWNFFHLQQTKWLDSFIISW